MRQHRAQGAIEYLVLVTAVISVLMVFLNVNGPFRKAVEKNVNADVNMINRMVDDVPILF